MNCSWLLEDYPELEPEDIQAVLLYAADLVSFDTEMMKKAKAVLKKR